MDLRVARHDVFGYFPKAWQKVARCSSALLNIGKRGDAQVVGEKMHVGEADRH